MMKISALAIAVGLLSFGLSAHAQTLTEDTLPLETFNVVVESGSAILRVKVGSHIVIDGNAQVATTDQFVVEHQATVVTNDYPVVFFRGKGIFSDVSGNRTVEYSGPPDAEGEVTQPSTFKPFIVNLSADKGAFVAKGWDVVTTDAWATAIVENVEDVESHDHSIAIVKYCGSATADGYSTIIARECKTVTSKESGRALQGD